MQTSLLSPARATLAVRTRTAPIVLSVMVAVSAVVQFAAAVPRASVMYLPDEYLYSQLARSLGTGHGATVLGQSASLPAMLEPLLIAGFWTSSNAETSIYLTQAFHSIVVALAAIPVYLIARELRLTTSAALTSSLVALVAPGMVYASYLTADALGYLLALVAVHAAVRVFSRTTVASQCWFLTAAGLAIFARLQYATLIPAFLVSALVIERFRPFRAARRFGVIAIVVGLGTTVALVVGGAVLGRYGSITGFGISASTLDWTAKTTAFLMVVTGAAIAPGALAWAVVRVARPTDRPRAGFAALSLVLLGSIVVAAAMVSADTHSDRFLERYLLVAFPLVAIGFFCWIDEHRPGRVIAIVASVVVVIAASRVPVTGDLIGQGNADSPTLAAISRLGGMIGLVEASLVAALVVTAGAALAIVASVSRRVPSSVLVVPTILVLGIAAAGAHAADLRSSKRAHANAFGGAATWVDAERAGPTLLVQTPGSNPFVAMVTTVFNSSIVRAAPLGTKDMAPVDGLAKASLSTGSDGILREHTGRPVSGSALFATDGSSFVFAEGDRVVRDTFFSLVIPSGDKIRLRASAEGVRSNNTVGRSGRLTAYPGSRGMCTRATLRMSLPSKMAPTVIEFHDGDSHSWSRRVVSGKFTDVSVTSTSRRSSTLTFEATQVGNLGPGLVIGAGADRRLVNNVATGRITAANVACGTTT